MVPKMTYSLFNMWSTLVVAPIYVAIFAAAPFRNCIILSWTTPLGSCPWCTGHCDFTVQKISWSFWGGITTEGTNMASAHPQPSHECVEESADIWSELRGAYGPWCRLTIPPSPLPSWIYFPIIRYGFPATMRGPRFPWDNPSRGLLHSSRPFWFGEPLALPVIYHCQGPRHPG